MKYHNIPTLFDNQASLINGKNIGTDSVRYIQDAGQKTAGTTYIDRNTNELYVCVTTTNSVNNDSNFSKFNLKEAFNKLDSLGHNYMYRKSTYVRLLSSLDQLRSMDYGDYFIASIKSEDRFFEVVNNLNWFWLEIFKSENIKHTDTWIKLTNVDNSVFAGFLNTNGSITNIRKIY